MLLGAGAELHARQDGALQMAALGWQPAIVTVLAEAGANLNTDKLLRPAAQRGDAETVRALLEAGADPRAADGEALKPALAGGHARTASLLRRWIVTEVERKASEGSQRH